MATIINNPSTEGSGESHASLALIVIVLLVAGLLLYMYGLPGRQDTGTNFSIPETVDVNVNTPSTGGTE